MPRAYSRLSKRNSSSIGSRTNSFILGGLSCKHRFSLRSWNDRKEKHAERIGKTFVSNKTKMRILTPCFLAVDGKQKDQRFGRLYCRSAAAPAQRRGFEALIIKTWPVLGSLLETPWQTSSWSTKTRLLFWGRRIHMSGVAAYRCSYTRHNREKHTNRQTIWENSYTSLQGPHILDASLHYQLSFPQLNQDVSGRN